MENVGFAKVDMIACESIMKNMLTLIYMHYAIRDMAITLVSMKSKIVLCLNVSLNSEQNWTKKWDYPRKERKETILNVKC